MKTTSSTAAHSKDFHYPVRILKFWRRLAIEASRRHLTPFYIFSAEPIREALDELKALDIPIPIRHWLSCKTQPIRPLLRWWRKQGRGIEVVSEFEFRAAIAEGFKPEQILVNGPAKHHWLPKVALPRLSINFDSLREIEVLLPLARALDWRLGIRFLTREEFDPENPELPTQFGFEPRAAIAALKRLQKKGARVETAHFHLRTNVASARIYERAIREIAEICRAAQWSPKILDCGGGFPPRHTLSRYGRAISENFDLKELAEVYRKAARWLPNLEEIWLENGRYVSARSGVLVIKVLDVKERRGLRQLICDGGRTTHALISHWESHQLLILPNRRGLPCLTAVCGPTCMAFDQLTRRQLPRDIREGDLLVWMESGAYHIPWETRFSYGLSTVLWHENGKVRLARERETFEAWWAQWK